LPEVDYRLETWLRILDRGHARLAETVRRQAAAIPINLKRERNKAAAEIERAHELRQRTLAKRKKRTAMTRKEAKAQYMREFRRGLRRRPAVAGAGKVG